MQRWTDRGAAIIAQGDKIILMRRERGFGKNKQIYYTIPGGGREEGEKIEETAIREIKEELGIDIKVKKLMYKLNTYMRMQYVFLGEYVSRNTSELEKVKNMKKKTIKNMVNIYHK
mgnify:FL=1